MYAVTHCGRYNVLPVGFVSDGSFTVIAEALPDDS
jgi:hypothetical protein